MIETHQNLRNPTKSLFFFYAFYFFSISFSISALSFFQKALLSYQEWVSEEQVAKILLKFQVDRFLNEGCDTRALLNVFEHY